MLFLASRLVCKTTTKMADVVSDKWTVFKRGTRGTSYKKASLEPRTNTGTFPHISSQKFTRFIYLPPPQTFLGLLQPFLPSFRSQHKNSLMRTASLRSFKICYVFSMRKAKYPLRHSNFPDLGASRISSTKKYNLKCILLWQRWQWSWYVNIFSEPCNMSRNANVLLHSNPLCRLL